MKLTIESTDEFVEADGKRLGRIWRGEAEDGAPVLCCIAWVSPQTHDFDVNDRFANELVEVFPSGQVIR